MEFTQGERYRIYVDPSKLRLHPPPSVTTVYQSYDGESGASEPARDPRASSSYDSHQQQILAVPKEHMFDKVVTPSDVGKLNRLVIPKQHAEKYFPLEADHKGTLLSFEDRLGKPWRFRYSYWNSSQSYVMTKGWSRFVKDKRLDAGDTVSFARGVGDARNRLFIDCKRRAQNQGTQAVIPFLGPWAGRSFPASFNRHSLAVSGSVGDGYFPYQWSVTAEASRRPEGPGDRGLPVTEGSVPVSGGLVSAKRVRLFGVNLDWLESNSDAVGREENMQLTELHHNSGAESSGGSSSSTGKEQRHSALDLEL